MKNKWEHVSEQALDLVLDHLNTLNDLTPKIKCSGRTGVDCSVIFGLDSQLFMNGSMEKTNTAHNDEVETLTVYRGPGRGEKVHYHLEACDCGEKPETFSTTSTACGTPGFLEEHALRAALESLSKEIVWRVKGFVRVPGGTFVVNWAFGRFELTKVGATGLEDGEIMKLTVMGERGEVRRAAKAFSVRVGAELQ